jgi:aminoglycoside phosphotransferase (APT) family kinase protein
MIAPDAPSTVRQGEEVNLESLNKYLALHGQELGLISSQEQFPGGYSNLTYLLKSDKGEFILRRPPFGAAIKSAHDMGREFKVLSLLRDHYPKVPAPLVYCDNPEVIGAPFYIMERIRGVILRPGHSQSITLTPLEMRAVSESLVNNLAAMHAIDINSTGLVQLGKPDGYISRQVEGWSKRYSVAQTEPIRSMEELTTWLSKSSPVEGEATLLHNDYKYDNLVLDAGDLTNIKGVLDWEMATVGDPWMDVGASLAYWAEKKDGELARVFNISWLPGNLTRKEFVDRYVAMSRKPARDPLFYYVFGLFKNAVIAQQIYSRWKQGHSKDPRFGQLIHVIKDLGRRGMVAIEKDSI